MKKLMNLLGMFLFMVMMTLFTNSSYGQYDTTMVDGHTYTHIDSVQYLEIGDTLFTFYDPDTSHLTYFFAIVDDIKDSVIDIKYKAFIWHGNCSFYIDYVDYNTDQYETTEYVPNYHIYEVIFSYDYNIDYNISYGFNYTVYVDLRINKDFSSSSSISDFIYHNDINIYPNPCVDKITISGDIDTISLYDVSGKLLTTTNENSIDMIKYEKGMYILIIDNKYTKKIIKN